MKTQWISAGANVDENYSAGTNLNIYCFRNISRGTNTHLNSFVLLQQAQKNISTQQA